MSTINILCVGDVVGENGGEFIKNNLWKMRSLHRVDFCVVNGENCGKYNSVEPYMAKLLLSSGADVVTGGNHSFKRAEMHSYLETASDVLRPANFPSSCPGQGHVIKNINGFRVLVMSMMGQVFMDPLACPFETAERILARESGAYDFSVCDFHAEATSEKLAFAHAFDGKINVIFGTHTHVQTADLQILAGGTGYITDIGMSGPHDSVIGIKKEIIVEKFRTKLPKRFEVATTPCKIDAALFTLDTDKGRMVEVKKV